MVVNKCEIAITTLLLVSTFGYCTEAQWAIDDNGCRTPDRGVGNCVVIQKCIPLINLMTKITDLTPEIVERLRAYKCGYEGNNVKVCCPDKPIVFNISGQTGQPTVPLRPDVSNHPNRDVLPTNCGFVADEVRIVHGNKTGITEFPWMALLSYQTRYGVGFRCGGTIINSRYILTAAHCITNLGSLKLNGVRVGEHNIATAPDCEMPQKNVTVCNGPVQDTYIDEVIPHPNYNSTTYSDDIGLLRTSDPIVFTGSVKAICLPYTEEFKNLDLTEDRLIVTGWGATENGSKSNDLLQAGIPFQRNEDCEKAYTNIADISYKQMCAGGVGFTDSCTGDSGGPLQKAATSEGDIVFVQVGIVSFGPRNCGRVEGIPGVYTRVDYYMDWILDNMRP